MIEVLGERRHPVVFLPVEPLVRRIADQAEHPFVGAVAGQVGGQAKLAVVAEPVAAAVQFCSIRPMPLGDQLRVLGVRFALRRQLGLGREGGGDRVAVIVAPS